jgi:glycosyltransferase involved in cell wall biosynthesis
MVYSTHFFVACITGVLVLIQLFYYLFFFARLAFYKKKQSSVLKTQYPVSIIVCAFNEEANLRKNLPLLLNQNYLKNGQPFFEVVVVNDNSQDETFYLLNQLSEKYAHLHVVNLTQEAKLIPGKKFPLSMGIKSAKCEHLLLTDADCIPASNEWLSTMAQNFSDEKKIVLGYSPYYRYEGFLNKKIRFETVHSAMQYLSYALAGTPYMGVGRNLAYVRDLFNKNKGFSSHHHIVSGDDDLFINQVATRKNTVIEIEPESFVYSEPKKIHDEWHNQKKRHLSTGKYYQAKHQALLGIYSITHFLFWLSLIPCILFPKFIIYVAIAFVIRWMVQWYIFQKVFIKLKEKDLINYIWLFDVWLLFYNIKSVPSIFLKNKIYWK